MPRSRPISSAEMSERADIDITHCLQILCSGCEALDTDMEDIQTYEREEAEEDSEEDQETSEEEQEAIGEEEQDENDSMDGSSGMGLNAEERHSEY